MTGSERTSSFSTVYLSPKNFADFAKEHEAVILLGLDGESGYKYFWIGKDVMVVEQKELKPIS